MLSSNDCSFLDGAGANLVYATQKRERDVCRINIRNGEVLGMREVTRDYTNLN